jgi:hypothetical protein
MHSGSSSHKSGHHPSSSYMGSYDGTNNHYQSGLYNNYNYRPGGYANTQGSLCKNYANYDGVVYGQFYCPIEGFSYDDTRCCGPYNEQYCCNERDYRVYNNNDRDEVRYYSRNERKKQSSAGIGLVFLFVVLPLLACMICTLTGVFFCVKKRIYQKIPLFKSSSDKNDDGEANPKEETKNEEANEEPLVKCEQKDEPSTADA